MIGAVTVVAVLGRAIGAVTVAISEDYCCLRQSTLAGLTKGSHFMAVKCRGGVRTYWGNSDSGAHRERAHEVARRSFA